MNRYDIIRMAREAHRELVTVDYPGHAGQLDPWTMRLLERFAALAAEWGAKQERDRHTAVMRQALEALEGLFGVPDEFTGSGGGGVAVWRGDGSEPVHKAITALRVALEGKV